MPSSHLLCLYSFHLALVMHIELFYVSFPVRDVTQQGWRELDGHNHPDCCGCCFCCQTIDLTATWCSPALLVGVTLGQGRGDLRVSLRSKKSSAWESDDPWCLCGTSTRAWCLVNMAGSKYGRKCGVPVGDWDGEITAFASEQLHWHP